jgi:asparagine synthase (glutamine-hydrolysing)
MCGIAGILSLNGQPLDRTIEERLAKMSEAIRHRGPNDDGIYLTPDRRAAFAHRRLAIIDPTPEAHQPMVSPRGNVLIFNGEIYNYRELRERYNLDTPLSDTAVVLALLEQSGVSILPLLRGFFTFAFWNEAAKELLIARDAIGKKPLYYSNRNGIIIFASELRAVLQSGLIPFSISQEVLSRYLTYYSVPQPDALIEHVHTLPAGSTMSVNERGMKIEQWYRLPGYHPVKISYDDAVLETRRLLESSVKYRLVSDVPVGAFLSGGIDSNAIVGLMSREVSTPVETFSIGFPASKYVECETDWARIGAQHFGTKHHERIISDRDVAALLPDFFSHLDSPTGDGLNSFLVAKTAREASPSLKVVLSGVGGDELFLGYRKYRWLAQNARWLRLVWALPLSARRKVVSRVAGGSSVRLFTALKTIFDPVHIRALFGEDEIDKLIGPDLRHSPALDYQHPKLESDEIISLLRSDIEHYLPEMLLRDLDVTTMSQGLEARAPLLDTKLMEFAWHLPLELKARGGHSKQLLADAVRDILPTEIRHKPKTGFELPMREWLLTGALRPYLDLIQEGPLELVKDGLLIPEAVRRIHHDFILGRSHYLKPWSIIALEYWYRSMKNSIRTFS